MTWRMNRSVGRWTEAPHKGIWSDRGQRGHAESRTWGHRCQNCLSSRTLSLPLCPLPFLVFPFCKRGMNASLQEENPHEIPACLPSMLYSATLERVWCGRLGRSRGKGWGEPASCSVEETPPKRRRTQLLLLLSGLHFVRPTLLARPPRTGHRHTGMCAKGLGTIPVCPCPRCHPAASAEYNSSEM